MRGHEIRDSRVKTPTSRKRCETWVTLALEVPFSLFFSSLLQRLCGAEGGDYVRAYLQARQYRVAQVTLDWEDYLWNSAYARCEAKNAAASIAWLRSSYLDIASQYLDLGRAMARLVYGHDINHVLLLHLGAFSSTILPDALDLLKKKGYTLVTLEEAESDPAYQGDLDAGSKYGGTLLEEWMDARKIAYPPVAKKPYKELADICK